MKMAIVAFALALMGPATNAQGEICKYVDSDGNIRYGSLGDVPGWRKLGCAGENEVEPAPGYPQDPGKVLRDTADHAARYKCYLENQTRRKTCIEVAVVRSNGNLRASELLVGRPDRLRATAINLVVDCKTSRVALQERDGGLFAGALPVSEDAKAALAREICTVKTTRRDRRLHLR